MNPLLLVVILLGIAACATSGPEPNRSESVQASKPVQASEPVQASQSGQQEESGGGALAHNATAKNSTSIEAFEAPSVSEIPAEMIPGRPEPEPAVVCEKVVPTGSIIPVRVCRDRAYIERKQEADQEIFDDIKRNTALGNSRL